MNSFQKSKRTPKRKNSNSSKSKRRRSHLKRRISENDSGYLRRIYQELSPFQNIYSEDRFDQKDMIVRETYYMITDYWDEFLEKSFKDRDDIFIHSSLPEKPFFQLKHDFSDFSKNRQIVKWDFEFVNLKPFISEFNDSKIQIIIIPYRMTQYYKRDHTGRKPLDIKDMAEKWTYGDLEITGHARCVIINKYLDTIEFYDPNGSDSHHDYLSGWFDEDCILQEINTKIGDISRYKIYKNKDICPNGPGVQNLIRHIGEEEFVSKSGLEEFCIVWSMFCAYMRIKYYMIYPLDLMTFIRKRFIKMNDTEDAYWTWLVNWILHIYKTVEFDKKLNARNVVIPNIFSKREIIPNPDYEF